MHGGATPTGIAAGNFRTGRHSAALPSRLLERYTESLADPELLGIREEISLTDSRIADLLLRVDTGEAGETWRSLKETYYVAKRAAEVINTVGRASVAGQKAEDEFFKAFEAIGILIAEGAQDYQAWDEVNNMVEQRRRLTETETKRLKEAQRMVTSEQATALVAALVASVKRHVTDRTALAAISSDITGLLARGVGFGAQP